VTDTAPTQAPAPRRIKRGWMNLRVADVVRETHDTDTFILVDADEGGRAFDYTAGQYLTFRFDDVGPKPLVRSYTMSSSPNQPDFAAFTVKRVDQGVISNWLCDHVKVGSILRARGPIGKFVYDPTQDEGRLVMVAGGSGVTPFVSIMRAHVGSMGKPGSPKQMTLLVSYRSKEDLICWKELMQFKDVPGMAVYTTLSREDKTREGFWHGRITDEHIARAVGGSYADTTYMSCGPTAIMDHAVAHLRAAGVPEHRIKTESFES
jgi:ferredoxin-NADP reductase